MMVKMKYVGPAGEQFVPAAGGLVAVRGEVVEIDDTVAAGLADNDDWVTVVDKQPGKGKGEEVTS